MDFDDSRGGGGGDEGVWGYFGYFGGDFGVDCVCGGEFVGGFGG